MSQGTVAVTPLRKQALLLEARRARVEWVDSASSPFNLSNGDDDESLKIEQILSSTGSKPPSEIIKLAFTGENLDLAETSSSQAGTVLLRKARACASIKSSVDIVAKMYSGISPEEMEERVAKQLITQVNSKEVRDILAVASTPTETSNVPVAPLSSNPKAAALTKDLSVARKAAEGYEVFIQRLRSPESAELVQGMKHFVTSLESSIHSKVMESSQANVKHASPRGQKLVEGLTHFVSSWEAKRHAKKGGKKNQHGDNDHMDYEAFAKEQSQLFEEVTSSIQSYLERTTDALRTHVLWQGDSEDEFELQAKIAMESFLFQKLHDILWSLTVDDESDQEMSDKLASLQFITWKHLDINCLSHVDVSRLKSKREESKENTNGDKDEALERIIPVPSDTWVVPINALRFLDAQWSPTSKLVLIMKAYRGVTTALCAAMPEGDLPGADDTLPTLILALLHAQPRNIVSNLAFIQSFARPDLLRGEPGYVLTSVLSALHFLKELNDASALTISSEAFSEGLKKCKADIAKKSADKNFTSLQDGEGDNDFFSSTKEETMDDENDMPQKDSSSCPLLSARQVYEARNRGEEVDMDWALRWQAEQMEHTNDEGATMQKHRHSSSASLHKWEQLPVGFTRPYSYLGAQAEDIRVADVPTLLDEYQELVRFCESLLTTRNAELAAEQKRKMKKMREELESNAAAANVDLEEPSGLSSC